MRRTRCLKTGHPRCLCSTSSCTARSTWTRARTGSWWTTAPFATSSSCSRRAPPTIGERRATRARSGATRARKRRATSVGGLCGSKCFVQQACVVASGVRLCLRLQLRRQSCGLAAAPTPPARSADWAVRAVLARRRPTLHREGGLKKESDRAR
eukprot:2803211-Prymnesium_polylepis.1